IREHLSRLDGQLRRAAGFGGGQRAAGEDQDRQAGRAHVGERVQRQASVVGEAGDGGAAQWSRVGRADSGGLRQASGRRSRGEVITASAAPVGRGGRSSTPV